MLARGYCLLVAGRLLMPGRLLLQPIAAGSDSEWLMIVTMMLSSANQHVKALAGCFVVFK